MPQPQRQIPLEASLPSALPLSQPHLLDPTLQRTIELQQASLRSAHALGFWIVGVILLAISVSTGLLVCRSPRGTGRRFTGQATTRRINWTNASRHSDLPLCSSVTGTCLTEHDRCAGCRHIQDIKQLSATVTPQRSQSLSTISYEVDDAPPPYTSLEDLRTPVEARNPVLHTVIQMQTPPPSAIFCPHQFHHVHC
ncbi:hypothetical protein BIW11_08160 [Tropilaelaps mercedesae]|uniref:Uncharacterized protein n=1 Tax=Tropilaelaps mercedesae TaxID=418985 RepID=A0A1V9XQY8_9ACAR|nr:hypothetical protein BIW11_08160 [Tropilaelaps mercedesae]